MRLFALVHAQNFLGNFCAGSNTLWMNRVTGQIGQPDIFRPWRYRVQRQGIHSLACWGACSKRFLLLPMVWYYL